MDKAFFEGTKTEDVKLSSGALIGLPIRYYDWSAMMAHFPSPASKVRSLLPSEKLKPALFLPGTAVISFAAFQYREVSDMEPYNEFAIMVPVLYRPAVNLPGLPLLFPKRFSKFGLYIHHLPVTTQMAYDAGVEIWGYPKFLAQIRFEDEYDVLRCRLRAEGKDIITLEVKKLAIKTRLMSYYTYSVKNDQLLRTHIQTQEQSGTTRFKGGASYNLGDHAIAEELKKLEIGEKALERLYAPQVQSMLHKPSEQLQL